METKLAQSSSETIREAVRRRYRATARGELSSCGDKCCTSTSDETLGYSTEQSTITPEAANLGLGCGNQLAIASLQPGQTVLRSEERREGKSVDLGGRCIIKK